MTLSGRCLGPDSPKYSPILPKFSPKVVLEQTKGLFKFFLKDVSFPLCGLFLPGNRVRSQLKAVESKFDKNLFYPHNSCQLPVKKFWFQHFPVLGLYITKDISEKV